LHPLELSDMFASRSKNYSIVSCRRRDMLSEENRDRTHSNSVRRTRLRRFGAPCPSDVQPNSEPIRRCVLLLCVLGTASALTNLASPYVASAQEARGTPLVHRGAHVRVMRRQSNVWRDGYLVELDSTAVLVQQGGAGEIIPGLPVDTFPLASLRAVQASRGPQAHMGTTVASAIFGLMAGVGIGWIAKAPMALPYLALGGLTAGAVIGADQRSETWSPIDQRLRVSLRRVRSSRHAIEVSINVPFSP
jgi:hypothetical protein